MFKFGTVIGIRDDNNSSNFGKIILFRSRNTTPPISTKNPEKFRCSGEYLTNYSTDLKKNWLIWKASLCGLFLPIWSTSLRLTVLEILPKNYFFPITLHVNHKTMLILIMVTMTTITIMRCFSWAVTRSSKICPAGLCLMLFLGLIRFYW